MAHRAEAGGTQTDGTGARPGLGAAWRWVWDTRLVRAIMRYVLGAAGLYSGGVTWSALLALTAVLTILVNVARVLLGENPGLLDEVLRAVNTVVPGLVAESGRGGVIDPKTLVIDSFWHPVTIASVLVAVWTATNVMTGLRRSIRAMFGLDGAPPPIWVGKARDLMGFVLLAVGVLSSFTLSTAFGPWARPILQWLGVADGATARLVAAGAVLVAGVIDALVFAMLFRMIAGVRVVRRDLVLGSVVGACGAAGLRLAGTSLVGVVDDPVLASFAAVATLAVLVSLAVRWTLFVAAWTSNPPAPPMVLSRASVRGDQRPNYVTRSAPATLEWPHHAVTGALLPSDPATGRVMEVAGEDDTGPR